MRSSKKSNRVPRRLGAVAVYMALLLPLLISFIVFGVDYGTITVARQELQVAADMGAVSTLRVLMFDRENADAAAVESIGNNSLFGQSIVPDVIDDVEYGIWDEDTEIFTVIPRVNDGPPPGASAVRISLERTRAEGNGVNLFIGPILGTNFVDMSVVSIASATGTCSGFVGIESADLRNNIGTNSYNSDNGNYGGANQLNNGDVCSGGPVTLASGADIVGDAMGSSVTIAQGSGATISGTRTESPAVLDYPSVDFSQVNDNKTSEINTESPPPYGNEFYNDSTGDLIIDQGKNLTLSEGTYRFRDLFLRGGSTLSIQGEVKIYIEREMIFDNGTVANLSQVPANMQIFVGAGPVNIQGGNQLYASIYAPDADVNVANGSGFFGSIIGKTLVAAGGAGLFFDETLAVESSAGARAKLVQ